MWKTKVHPFLAPAVLVLVFLLLAGSCVQAAEGLSEQERKLRDRTIEQVEKHWEIVKDPARAALVEMTGSRCAAFATRDLDYSFRLISEEQPNAFTIPGGVIYVTTGMLDFVRSDDELAAILSHELVHADKNHVMRQVARNQKLSVGTLLLTIASGGAGPVAILSSLVQVAVRNEYSQDFEREADRGSIEILHEAGYSPSATVTVLERLREEEAKRPYVDPGVFRTHPRTEERVRRIISFIRENDLSLERKVPLRILIPEIKCGRDFCVLTVDGGEIWSGPPSPETRKTLEKLEEAIEKGLQLETAPYDIHVLERKGNKKLLIGRTVAADQAEAPPGAASLDAVREALVRALQSAKRTHPVAEYFR